MTGGAYSSVRNSLLTELALLADSGLQPELQRGSVKPRTVLTLVVIVGERYIHDKKEGL